MWPLYFALFVLPVYILYHWVIWMNRARRVSKIPGKPCHPLLGHLNLVFDKVRNGCHLGEETAESLEFKDLPLFGSFMGPVMIVAATTPEGAEAVLSNNSLIDKAAQYNFLHSWLGTGLLTSTGEKWKSRRNMLTPSFHLSILEDFLPIMTRNASILTAKFAESSSTDPNHVISDICEPLLLCALDIICETAMGVSVYAQCEPDNEYVRNVHVAGQAFMARFTNPLLGLDAIFNCTPIGREYAKCMESMHRFTDNAIKKRKEQLEFEIKAKIIRERKCMTFMDTLICHHLKHGDSFTIEDVREEVDTFMFGGHDTTAWAITWCTYLIGLDDKIQEQLHRELDSVFTGNQGGEFNSEKLKRLNYTECCIKEALRLFPSVPILGRQTMVNTPLCGHLVPAGTQLGVFPYIIHRNETHWPEPEVFDPDRFSPEASRNRHPFAYVPFSAGQRKCIGSRFAMLEAKVMVASIFRTFKVTSLLPRDKVRISPSIILRSQLSIPVRLERRT